ncbi:putative membrane protein [Vibrio cholerae BJG-01]|nr:putative membrane protein [Vibrio cholerae BJG-01]
MFYCYFVFLVCVLLFCFCFWMKTWLVNDCFMCGCFFATYFYF